MSLTEEQEKEYIAVGGGYCPYCGNKDTEETFSDSTWEGWDNGRMCPRCGMHWKDVYILVLSAVEEMEEEDAE